MNQRCLMKFFFFLEPPTTRVATRTLTKFQLPVTVSFRIPIAPAPMPIGLAAALAALPPPAAAAAPAPSVALDTAVVEAAEAQVPERHQLPTQDVRLTNDDV